MFKILNLFDTKNDYYKRKNDNNKFNLILIVKVCSLKNTIEKGKTSQSERQYL